MAASSTVPAIKTALVTRLKARAGLSGVQVVYGHPGAQIQREAIFLRRTTGRMEIAVMTAGRKRRDETYTVELIVSVVHDEDVTKAEDRAFLIFKEVESELADDPRLGGALGLDWAVLEGFEAIAEVGPDGPIAEVKVQVGCRARLT